MEDIVSDNNNINLVPEIINEDTYEVIKSEKNIYKDVILKALTIVKQFIIDRNLILVGGLAIDYALKVKGDYLYDDTKLPDYDFYSSVHHKDAYDLGNILLEQGFDNISVIQGRHVTTMRVRINFITVADITYIPDNILKKIPTFLVDKMNIIHPHFQMIDQHLSISRPYENPPMETILFRFSKDKKRFNLLYNHYNLQHVYDLEYSTYKPIFKTNEISRSLFANNCLTGAIALSFWMNTANELNESYSVNLYTDNLFTFNLNSDNITYSHIDKLSTTFLTDKFEHYVSLYNSVEYNDILDKLSNRCEFELNKIKFKVYNNYGNKILAKKHSDFYVANLQEILKYFLTWHVIYKCTPSLYCYLACMRLLISSTNAINIYKNKDDNVSRKITASLIDFQPNAEVYGCCTIMDSDILNMQKLELIYNDKLSKIKMPKNYYPKPGKNVTEEIYNVNLSETSFFQKNGLAKHVNGQ